MKKIIVTTVICCSVFAAYVAGQQNTPKQKTIEPCCCKHTQQIAEDIHWLREQLSKPFIPPKTIHSGDGGEFQDPGKINVTPIKLPDIDSPKPRKR
jgi:hypothetical protein